MKEEKNTPIAYKPRLPCRFCGNNLNFYYSGEKGILDYLRCNNCGHDVQVMGNFFLTEVYRTTKTINARAKLIYRIPGVLEIRVPAENITYLKFVLKELEQKSMFFIYRPLKFWECRINKHQFIDKIK